MSFFYITTTLPYANAQPHLGHAIEFLQADVIARWRRSQWDKVIFNVGTDEHGLKMYQKAQENNESVEKFISRNRQYFIDFCQQFDISYDHFYATSNPKHHQVAQALWNACDARGDIYKKKYTGMYCVGCESFKTAKDLVDGKCPDHCFAPIVYEEENYFFRLSKYAETLVQYINQSSFVLPEHKNNELRNFVAKMEDISISRSRENLPRWVLVPGDESQVMYVWFDALSNYIGTVGYPDNMEQLAAFRGNDKPQAIQICGPDNLRFQWAIWQGMLASGGLPWTKTLLVHGMVLGPDGNKMSKTLGNVISPFGQIEQYGLDAFRFYMIAGIPTFGDASYKEEDLVTLYNSRLANVFGNLLNRVIHLANKNNMSYKWKAISSLIQEKIDTHIARIVTCYEWYDLYNVADEIHNLAIFANEYISRPGHEPWNKAVSDIEVQQVLVDCAAMLQVVINGYASILPETSARAQQMLDDQEKGILFERIV